METKIQFCDINKIMKWTEAVKRIFTFLYIY